MSGHTEVGFMESVRDSGVFRCLECGKCTAVCPISRYDRGFSPRRTVGRAVMSRDEALLTDDRLWACVTCLRCTTVCPAAVSYDDLTLSIRAEAHRVGRAAVCTHGEVLHGWMRLMADPALRQQRLGWLHDGDAQPSGPLRVAEEGATLYFVGCAPYFHEQFRHIGIDGNQVARSTVSALNALGIEPQVMADERCCGHDLLWEGDVDAFRQLAALNADLIRESGAERIVTSCPECARTLLVDYPAHGFDLGLEVQHLSQLVASALADREPIDGPHAGRDANGSGAAAAEGARVGAGDGAGAVDAAASASDGGDRGSAGTVTYHDPCRLGRHLGEYDAPRDAMTSLGVRLVEMPRNRERAECCGTNGWTHCGAANKSLQTDRLREAAATGADTLVTACLKCQIHFRCAKQDTQLGADTDIEIRDLSTMLAEGLIRNGSGPGGD